MTSSGSTGWTRPSPASGSAWTGGRSGRSWRGTSRTKWPTSSVFFPISRPTRPGTGRWPAWETLLGMSIKFGMENRSLRGSTNYGTVHRIRDGERAELGQYTFQITGAACLEYPDREAELQVVLRAFSPRFWERINPRAVVDNMTVVGPDGTRYAADSRRPADGSEKSDHTVWGDLFAEWGPSWREVAFFLPAEDWQPGDRVTLELDSEVGGIELSTAVTERVKMP